MTKQVAVVECGFDPVLKPRDAKKSAYFLKKMLSSLHWQCVECGGTADPEDTNSSRLETFAGWILGRDSRELKDGRSVVLGCGKTFKINDQYGPTRIVEFEKLALQLRNSYYSDLFRKIVREAQLFLEKMLELPTQKATYLQCNINAYRAGSDTHWHRDDVTVGPGQCPPTFHPAATTLLLLDETLSQPPLGRHASFQLCPALDKDGEFKSRTHRGDAPSDVLNFNKEFVFYGLRGENYLHGVHRASTGWPEPGSSGAGPFRRVSMNFRLVKKEAWDQFTAKSKGGILVQDPKEPGDGAKCACASKGR